VLNSDHAHTVKAELGDPLSTFTIKVLLDNGCLQGNYISKATASWLEQRGHTRTRDNVVVRGAFNQVETPSLGQIDNINLSMISYTDCFKHTFTINARILDTGFDLIIGRPGIKQHGLVNLFPSHFFAHDSVEVGKMCSCEGMNSQEIPTVVHSPHIIATTTKDRTKLIVSKDSLLDSAEPEEADHLLADKINPNLGPNPLSDNSGWTLRKSDGTEMQVSVVGTEEERYLIGCICQAYADLFSKDLPREPACLKPFRIDIDKTKWEKPQNMQRARAQSHSNNEYINKEVADMLGKGIIEISEAAYYSQVLLVNKAGSTPLERLFRFCIDYRMLNDATKPGTSWPIPHILRTLTTVGSKRPRYFAIVDFTSGYHQIGVAMDCRELLSFICDGGVYQYTRIPFGPKGAPSYFQKLMVTQVLSGLIHLICVVYLDDVLIFGEDLPTFLKNLETVMARFKRFGLTLNPKKCKFGLRQVEYVGHVLDEYGLTMSPEKLDKVINFAKPKSFKDMKSYLGLVNHFRVIMNPICQTYRYP
jgi:hypothetical protein